MTYLTLAEIKKHCNIDSFFTDDDTYLTALATASEDVIERLLDRPLSTLEDENHKLPQSLNHAMLLWVGQMYALREAVSSVNMSKIPYAFELLIDIWKNYSLTNNVE